MPREGRRPLFVLGAPRPPARLRGSRGPELGPGARHTRGEQRPAPSAKVAPLLGAPPAPAPGSCALVHPLLKRD